MRTVDQWNPLKVVFDMPHEADLKAAIMKFPLADRGYMVKEMLAYMGQFRGFGWVAPILSAAARRLFLGGTDSARLLRRDASGKLLRFLQLGRLAQR